MTDQRTETWIDSGAAYSAPRAVVPRLEPGVVLAERYRIQRKLGSGATGVVYAALDHARMDAAVALKLLVSQQPAALARLKNEFRALARTIHPNLVGLHGLGVDERGWFVVMDLVDPSSDFTRFVRTSESALGYDEARLRSALLQLLRGVSALHASGKLHRDLKPSNVLIDERGRVMIVDFGLLGDVQEGEHGGTFVGTPAYAAPEQVRARSVGPPADMYAIGVMLFEAITGWLPVDAPTTDALFERKLRAHAPLPAEIGAAPDLSELCALLLASDAGKRPSAEQALGLLGEAPSAHAPSGEPLFVARDEELVKLSEAALRTRSRGPGVALLHGASGIGKSALGAHFCALARQQHDALVLRGRCHPQEQVPYKAFDALIDALGEQLSRLPREEAQRLLPRDTVLLARVFPTLASIPAVATLLNARADGDPGLLRARAFAALRTLLARLAEGQLLVLYVDDLHWSDQDSMLLLRELWSAPTAPSFLFVATMRSDHPRPTSLDAALGELPAEARLELALGPLATSASLRMARALLGSNVEAEAPTRLVAESAGSPLLLAQLARTARERGSPLGLNETVAELLKGRSADERVALELICLAGYPMPHAVLLRAITLDSEQLRRVSGSWLVSARVQHDEHLLEPHHDRLREAVLDTLPPEHRDALHIRLARAWLRAPDSDPEQIAAHLTSAGAHAEAAPHLAIAGERALRALAFARASELYRRALEHEPIGPWRDRLELALARALASLGQISEAAEHYESILHRTREPALRHELCGEAMVLHVLGGRVERGAQLLDLALRALGQSSVPRSNGLAVLAVAALMARYHLGPRIASLPVPASSRHRGTSKQSLELSLRAARGFAQVSVGYGEYFALRTVLAIRRYRDRERWAVGIAFDVVRRSVPRGYADARDDREMERALALAEEQGDPESLALVWGSEGVRSYVASRYQRAAHALTMSEQVLRERGRSVFPVFNGSRGGRCAAWWALGQHDKVREHVPLWLREAQAVNDPFGELVLRLLSAPLRLSEDNPAGMLEAVRVLETPAARQTLFLCDPWWYGDPALYSGDVAGAWRAYRHARAQRGFFAVQRAASHRVAVTGYLGRLHLVAASQGNHARNLRPLRSLIRSLDRERHPVATPIAAQLRAGAANLLGDRELALNELVRAAHAYEALEIPVNAASMRFYEGRLRGGDQSRELTRQAIAAARERGIRNPARIFQWLAPGFP